MTWLLIGALVWVALAVPAALVIGRAIRQADVRRAAEVEAELRAHALEPETGNFVATEEPPAAVPPSAVPPSAVPPSLWTAPETTPAPPLPPQQRRRPPVVRAPVSRRERNPSSRDSGVL